ncbi:DedA family protein, partial [Campylobacter coli]
MQEIIHFIIETASDCGYLGIIILMTLESCFIPFPSEVVMIPAGYLAHKG